MSGINISNPLIFSNYFASKYHPSAHQGRTPGRFVVDYASRPSATEPFTLNMIKDPLLAANKTILAHPNLSPQAVSKILKNKYRLDGRSFDSKHISCLDNRIRKDGNLFQKLYQTGHSIDKSIISFSTPYLKRMGVVDPGFKMVHDGSGFGQADELKLRLAISRSTQAMAEYAHFVNPVFFGAIQFDTRNIHCHLILADNCPLKDSRRLVPVKNQKSSMTYKHLEDRGKLWRHERKFLKDSINFHLSLNRKLVPIHYQPRVRNYDLVNNVQLITSHEMNSNVRLQELIASLPKDTSKWSYTSHNHLMRHSNRLMDEYLDSLIAHRGHSIGYDNVIDTLLRVSGKYASKKYPQSMLYRRGRQYLRRSMADDVYGQLKKSIHRQQLKVTTPYLRNHAFDISELRQRIQNAYHGKKMPNEHLTMLLYWLDSYKLRYAYHAHERSYYLDGSNNNLSLRHFDSLELRHRLNPSASVLARPFAASEVHYHSQAMDKYRFILHISPSDKDMIKDLYSRRKQLMRQYKGFIRAPHYSELITPAYFTKLNKLLKNKGLRKTLGFHANHRSTLGQELQSYRSDLYKKPDTLVMRQLADIEHYLPQYRGARREIYDSRHGGYTRMPRRVKDQYTRYAYDLVQFDNDCFDTGLINANQIHDFQNICKHPFAEPPVLHRKGAIKARDFERDKGVDLDDCIYDIEPGHSRDVSQDTEDDYDASTYDRYKSALSARRYILQSNQQNKMTAKQVNYILHLVKLKKKRKMVQYLRRHHALPMTHQMNENISVQRHRNINTIDLMAAQRYSNRHMRDLNKTNDRVANTVSKKPQILFPDESKSVQHTGLSLT